jgi:hypothetical protein
MVEMNDHGQATDKPMDGFDVRYSSVCFNFKVNCPTDLDCKAQNKCAPIVRVQPEINYLAKDYASFKQLILDRLAVTLPQWREAHTADIGVMLVELLAYVGDSLSYYQDAVATEAYLGTARQRISVRRHARLVDYRMHEGCNARAFVTLWTDADQTLDADGIFFTTALDLPGGDAVDQHVLQAAEFLRAKTGTYEVFEPVRKSSEGKIQIFAAQSAMEFYTWGDEECCLPAGSTSATLVGDAQGLHLAVGDVLIFEEVIGPGTGDPADADPAHRQAVCLTHVIETVDALYGSVGVEGGGEAPQVTDRVGDRDAVQNGIPIVEIEWCTEDALTFSLCLSVKLPAPDCTVKAGISVARGNVVLVDHGVSTRETICTVGTLSTTERCGCECEAPEVVTTAEVVTPEISQTPLTYSQPWMDCGCACQLLAQDANQAMPSIRVSVATTGMTSDGNSVWTPVADLLESDATERSFVVETDNAGIAHLRFGDGQMGAMPVAGAVLTAAYRVGNGTRGNVGVGAISYLVFRSENASGGTIVPRNPMAARGGIDPEPIEEVKQFAPTAFRSKLERAITADDYATLAADNARRLSERTSLSKGGSDETLAPLPREAQEEEAGDELPPLGDLCRTPFRRLQGAKARLRWTGSWNEVCVALDPLGTEEVEQELIDEVLVYLDPYRRVGHDVSVKAPSYVGLDVGLSICVQTEYLRAHVEAALLNVLSNRTLADGSKGIFHPDNLTFGKGVYASQIVGAVQAVEGVQSCSLIRLKRYAIGEAAPSGAAASANDLPAGGKLALGPFEIARVDDDPTFPEYGRLTLRMGGGR